MTQTNALEAKDELSKRLGVAADCSLVAPSWDIHEGDDVVAESFEMTQDSSADLPRYAARRFSATSKAS